MNKILDRVIKIALIVIILMSILLISNVSIATTEIQNVDYSEEYKQWLKLSDEEKEKVTMPAMYDNKVTSNAEYISSLDNVMKITSLLKSSLTSKYNLKDVIPSNTQVKDQKTTSGCWAFAMLGSLETNLALQDKQNDNGTKIYDFSERHMIYATTREAFLNNAINENGFTKSIAGGNSLIGNAYLTNGLGAIPEYEMPFENNERNIDISQIQNKKITAMVIDSEIFAKPTTSQEKEELKSKIKEHIKNYGGVASYIHGAQVLSDYYNNSTGALYCDDASLCKMDHEVLIVGWDDNFSKENFNEQHRPSNNGAWIIKNSWGEKQEFDLMELKGKYYGAHLEECIAQGWQTSSDVPNDLVIDNIIRLGYTTDKMIVNRNTLSIIIGDKGYMYVSYDDVNVFNNLYGIVKSTRVKDYDNIYQYDVLGSNAAASLKSNIGYLANVYERDATKQEYLTKISVNTLVDMGKCKVLVNPNNDSKNISDLQEVTLLEGSYETLKTGYNTIEFANPIKLTGNSFVVALKVENDVIYIPLSIKTPNSYYQNAELKVGKSFAASERSLSNNAWTDFTSTDVNESIRGNIAIKAFTNNEIEKVSLSEIQITNPPKKVKYTTGEKFDTTGMIVTAKYTDGTKKEVSTYKVTNGNSLQLGQESVTISYTQDNITKTAIQNITVEKPVTVIQKIEIKTKPTKLEYIKNVEDLNLTGGIIKATYSDSSIKEIPMTDKDITATGYDKTKLGNQTITISYKEKIITFIITVKEKNTNVEEKPPVSIIEKIEIKTKPTKLEYINNVDDLNLTGGIIKATYSDSSIKEIPMTDKDITATGYDKTKLGNQTITISYKEKIVTFNITVKEEQKKEPVENPKEEPTLSNFKNTKANIIKASSYVYTKNDKAEYTTMTINLTGIKEGDSKSKREYYYYLSGKQGEENNIVEKNWIKIEKINKQNDGTYTAIIEIDSRKLANANELENSKNLYVYVKENAELNNIKSTSINQMNIELKTEIEVYKDDVKQQNINNITNNKDQNNTDTTVASGEIPQTGINTTITVVFVILTAIGIFTYIKIRKMKDVK